MGITVDFGGPFRLAAVAFAVVGRHDLIAVCCCCCCLGELVMYFFFERERERDFWYRVREGLQMII